MDAAVGLGVGATVGLGVGAAVGLSVGAAVGLGVGAAVGLGVGVVGAGGTSQAHRPPARRRAPVRSVLTPFEQVQCARVLASASTFVAGHSVGAAQ